jgi:DNA-binding MurR/RpiR family transcriptional regulator
MRAIIKLENYLNDCTDGERQAVLYMVQHTKEMVDQDIHTIAKKCYCSSATIVRIAKKNDYKGFRELKKELILDLNNIENIDSIDINKLKLEDTDQVLVDITNNNIRAIKQTAELIDYNILLKVVHLIKEQEYISLFGMGASFIACKDLQMKLERVNKKTSLYEDTHLQLIRSSNVSENELAIMISYSGETQEIIKMAKNIKKNHGIIISIVKYGRTDLSDLSDYVLYVPAFEQELRVSASSSRISQLNMIDIIYHSYLKEVYDIKIKNILETSRMLKKEVRIN